MLGLQAAGGHLSQHGGKKQVIALAYQRDRQVRVPREYTLQSLRCRHPRKAAAQNDHPLLRSFR